MDAVTKFKKTWHSQLKQQTPNARKSYKARPAVDGAMLQDWFDRSRAAPDADTASGHALLTCLCADPILFQAFKPRPPRFFDAIQFLQHGHLDTDFDLELFALMFNRLASDGVGIEETSDEEESVPENCSAKTLSEWVDSTAGVFGRSGCLTNEEAVEHGVRFLYRCVNEATVPEVVMSRATRDLDLLALVSSTRPTTNTGPLPSSSTRFREYVANLTGLPAFDDPASAWVPLVAGGEQHGAFVTAHDIDLPDLQFLDLPLTLTEVSYAKTRPQEITRHGTLPFYTAGLAMFSKRLGMQAVDGLINALADGNLRAVLETKTVKADGNTQSLVHFLRGCAHLGSRDACGAIKEFRVALQTVREFGASGQSGGAKNCPDEAINDLCFKLLLQLNLAVALQQEHARLLDRALNPSEEKLDHTGNKLAGMGEESIVLLKRVVEVSRDARALASGEKERQVQEAQDQFKNISRMKKELEDGLREEENKQDYADISGIVVADNSAEWEEKIREHDRKVELLAHLLPKAGTDTGTAKSCTDIRIHTCTYIMHPRTHAPRWHAPGGARTLTKRDPKLGRSSCTPEWVGAAAHRRLHCRPTRHQVHNVYGGADCACN